MFLSFAIQAIVRVCLCNTITHKFLIACMFASNIAKLLVRYISTTLGRKADLCAAAAAIFATPPAAAVRARCAATADIFVDQRGGVTVPNSSLWLCVRAKLHICLLIVC